MILGRVAYGACGNDGSLTGHKARLRGYSPHRSRIRQRHGRVLKVAGLNRPFSNSADQVLIGGQKLLESQFAGALDVRHKQGARAVLPLDINGDARVYRMPGNTLRVPIGELKAG